MVGFPLPLYTTIFPSLSIIMSMLGNRKSNNNLHYGAMEDAGDLIKTKRMVYRKNSDRLVNKYYNDLKLRD